MKSACRSVLKQALAYLFAFCITGLRFLPAQEQTIGLFHNDPEAFPGYTLFAPLRSTNTYLIDNQGRQIQSWSSAYKPGLAACFLENGHLLRTANPRGNQTINAGGAGGVVEEYDWDGTLLWEFEYSNSQVRLHHDIEHLPNGNVLMIAWEYKTTAEAIEAGRDPDYLNQGALWPDHIIEVQPDGNSGGTIVWEWHVWDHLIQQHDETKQNYGNVADHPELVDINFSTNQNQHGNADWNHINGIDYHPEFDQILLSVHNFSEVWIIDHSTSSAEAASHQGGNSGRGGDLLYRWGNPEAYGAGTSSDRTLYGQHDANWVREGVAGAGNILLFNNGPGRPGGNHSTVDEFELPVDAEGMYTPPAPGEAFAPDSQLWIYEAPDPDDFFSQTISGATRLPNGNTLICEGESGRFFEVDADSEIVWEYINPVVESGPLQQGTIIPSGANGQENNVFKIQRYAPDHAGFEGLILMPGELIELPADIEEAGDYPVVDTGQVECFGLSQPMDPPEPGEAFHGQDAQHMGNQPSYMDHGDGTVTDNISGLMWQNTIDQNDDGVIDTNDKQSYPEALLAAESLDLAGHEDWRLPTLKELYSLILMSGRDISGPNPTLFIPFIDQDFFEFGYGDTNADERLIDAQYLSSTLYAGQTMNGDETVFGVNFADGRIKGYPLVLPQGNEDNRFYVQFVRGTETYAANDFSDNGDGTITDEASSLMWQQGDSDTGLNWEEALAQVELHNAESFLGYSDWRLPDVKELQSIVDYTRSPQTTNSAAIDPLFTCSEIVDEAGDTNYPFYWSSTTHANELDGSNAAYVCFGEALGWMEMPPGSGNYTLLDVHGAGAQRSDPKVGDPADYPYGHGPQGDVVRIYNHVRLVRNVDETRVSDEPAGETLLPLQFELHPNFPNPFNPGTTISFSLSQPFDVTLDIFNIEGQKISTLLNANQPAGMQRVTWQGMDDSHIPVAAGVYFYRLATPAGTETRKMILLR